MGCSSCQQNNHVVPSTHVHNPTTQTHCECACGCSEPVCPTPQPCTEITDSKCIIYTDAVIKCGNDTVVTKNASVSTALNQLATYFCSKQGLATTEAILCDDVIIVPAGTDVQSAFELVVQFICNIQLTPGPAGAVGPQGLTGATGPQGIMGMPGSPGSPSIITVSTNTFSSGNQQIGLGARIYNYTFQNNLGWILGQRLRASAFDGSMVFMGFLEGVISAVSSTSVTIQSDLTSGSGTYFNWRLGLAGEAGATGATGIQGIQGPIGPAGGVTQIIAGTNVTISPLGGTGAVTINSSGGGGGSQFTYEIGQYVASEGGVVMHRWLSTSAYGVPDSNGLIQNYIVMDMQDASLSASWGLNGLLVSNCDSLWDGQANTNAMILAGAAVGTAAELCNIRIAGGKADWYLPALDELRYMFENRFLINLNQSNLLFSPLTFANYWSSTQLTDTLAWHLSFINGVASSPALTKDQTINVRAVRRFTI